MNRDTQTILDHVAQAKDEILEAIKNNPKKTGRPKRDSPTVRGPSNTRMMKIQRVALITYVYVELHKRPEDVTLANAYHVWNMPEHKVAWDNASRQKNARRGYKDYRALYGAVRALTTKKDFKLSEINIV